MSIIHRINKILKNEPKPMVTLVCSHCKDVMVAEKFKAISSLPLYSEGRKYHSDDEIVRLGLTCKKCYRDTYSETDEEFVQRVIDREPNAFIYPHNLNPRFAKFLPESILIERKQVQDKLEREKWLGKIKRATEIVDHYTLEYTKKYGTLPTNSMKDD